MRRFPSIRGFLYRRSVVSLTLGAALTILVAWWLQLRPSLITSPQGWKTSGCVLTSEEVNDSATATPGALTWMAHNRETSTGHAEIHLVLSFVDAPGLAEYRRTALVDRDVSHALAVMQRLGHRLQPVSPEDDSDGYLVAVVSHYESGFPLRSLRCWNEGLVRVEATSTLDQWSVQPSAWMKSKFRFRRDDLPLRPLPLGFAVNTLFYAALILIPWELLAWARRARRRSRGLCARCAHSLAGLPDAAPCPECGTSPRPARPANDEPPT